MDIILNLILEKMVNLSSSFHYFVVKDRRKGNLKTGPIPRWIIYVIKFLVNCELLKIK